MSYGDYYDYYGNHLGNDDIDDGKIYMVEGSSKFKIEDFKKGGKYHNNQIKYNEDNKDNKDSNFVNEVDNSSDLSLLSRIGYAEFRGSNSKEQQVGMYITMNRVKDKKYPNTLEKVIRQPWQYSSLNKNDPNKKYFDDPASTLSNKANKDAWIRSVSNAISIIYGDNRGISQGATLYYSPRSMIPPNSLPKWNFNILQEINITGIRSSHLKIYQLK
jgi:spore germination cell wall hydrolase CwlJ-like protein